MPKNRKRRCSLGVSSKNISNTYYSPLPLLWKHQKACLWLLSNRGTLPPTLLFLPCKCTLGSLDHSILESIPSLHASCLLFLPFRHIYALRLPFWVPLIRTILANQFEFYKKMFAGETGEGSLPVSLQTAKATVKSCSSPFYRKS